MNRCENLAIIEFANMEVPKKLYSISSLDQMRFVNCTFENILDLRKVNPAIKLEALGTNITTDGFIGNA